MERFLPLTSLASQDDEINTVDGTDLDSDSTESESELDDPVLSSSEHEMDTSDNEVDSGEYASSDTSSYTSSEDDTSTESDQSDSEVGDQKASGFPGCPSHFLKPLYDSANITIIDSYLMLLQYSIRHSLTKKAFTELLQLLSVHLPSGSHAAESFHKIKSVFLKMFDDIKQVEYWYCAKCHRLISDCTNKVCPSGCNAPSEEFLHIPLGPQIKRKIEGKYASRVHGNKYVYVLL